MLQTYVDWLHDFVVRFFECIDPESGPVKGSAPIYYDVVDHQLLLLRLHSIRCFGILLLDRVDLRLFLLMVEWNNRTLTRLFGDKYAGCYALALTIFVLGIVRDYLCLPHAWLSNCSFERALRSQPTMEELELPVFRYLGAGLLLVGNIFVLSSMYKLGITGTYLGATHSRTVSDSR